MVADSGTAPGASSPGSRLAARLARATVRCHLDRPALQAVVAVLRRRPRQRVAGSLGWHLGQAAEGTPRVARLRSGGRVAVDIRDYAHRHILLFGVYEEEVTRLVHRIGRPGWTVVDVGANAGYFSLLAADVGGPTSSVVAFEPNPRMGDLLRETVALNPGARVETVAAACGEHDGSATLSLSPEVRNTGLSTLRPSLTGAEELTVPLVRLDGFCEQRGLEPDLIKIDVEGAEHDVLLGAEGLLRSAPPRHVICEVWPDSRRDLFAYMAQLGYRPFDIEPDGGLVASDVGAPEWCNICFAYDGQAARSR